MEVKCVCIYKDICGLELSQEYEIRNGCTKVLKNKDGTLVELMNFPGVKNGFGALRINTYDCRKAIEDFRNKVIKLC